MDEGRTIFRNSGEKLAPSARLMTLVSMAPSGYPSSALLDERMRVSMVLLRLH